MTVNPHQTKARMSSTKHPACPSVWYPRSKFLCAHNVIVLTTTPVAAYHLQFRVVLNIAWLSEQRHFLQSWARFIDVGFHPLRLAAFHWSASMLTNRNTYKNDLSNPENSLAPPPPTGS
ncbi:unnamed protein product [Ectocarpus sp. 12 AP-2014]